MFMAFGLPSGDRVYRVANGRFGAILPRGGRALEMPIG
jgi:hypothetical protein